MNTFQQVIGLLATLAASWKPNVNLQNDIEDGILALNDINNSGLTTKPLGGAFLKTLTKDAASWANLASGQLAQGFVVDASFDGVPDKVLIFGVRQYAGLTAPPSTPAEMLKAAEGY